MSLTSGLHGPRVLLTIPNTFDDFVVISVICFAQDSLESTAIIAVVAAHVRCRWRLTDRDRRTMVDRCFIQINIRAGDSVFAIVLGVFCVYKNC